MFQATQLKHATENELSPETRSVPPDGGGILIVGGYGHVGRSIARRIAPIFLGRVIVAGRNLDKARRTAAEIGHGVEARAICIRDPGAVETLHDVAIAVVCLDQCDTRFVEQCFARGIDYVDIRADYEFLSQVDGFDHLAKHNGATAMLSVGVARGLTKILAARAVERMDRTDRIDIVLELGLGDDHGRAALEWMFDNLDAAYEVQENGRPKSVRSFGESIKHRSAGSACRTPGLPF